MNIQTETPARSVPEVLLMLRAPGAGWLATLLAAADEAVRDGDFSAAHREILQQYLEEGVPAAVSEAARARTFAFQSELAGADVSTLPAPQHRVA